MGNVHEIAQDVNPAARVVYVDNDPIVLAHGRALLDSTPEGKSVYIEADMREPEKILAHPVTRDTLDFSKPVALMLVAVLHFFPDDDEARRIVEPPGRRAAAGQLRRRFARSPPSSSRRRSRQARPTRAAA